MPARARAGLRGAAAGRGRAARRRRAAGRAWACLGAGRAATTARCASAPASRRPARARRTVRIEGETVAARAPGRARAAGLAHARAGPAVPGGASASGGASSTAWSSPPSPPTPPPPRPMRGPCASAPRLLADGPRRPGLADALEAAWPRAGRAWRRRARADAGGAAGRDRRARPTGPSPRPDCRLTGEWETAGRRRGADGRGSGRLGAALAASRDRDAAAGRALTGPHRGDLAVIHRGQGPSRGGMFHRRAESADPEPGSGPGGATFPCGIAAKSYIVAGRGRRASGRRPAGRAVRRDRGARRCRPS